MPSSGKHFELSDWVDYVRKVGGPERLAAMERHLVQDGCERCGRLAEMLQSAYGASRMLSEVDVPESALGRARQIFQGQPAKSWWDLPARIGAWVQAAAEEAAGPSWAMAGVRTAGAHRQRLYRSGDWQVRLEAETSADGRQVVVGVVSSMAGAGDGRAGMPVLLVSGQQTLAQTATSEYGEFELSAPAGRRVRLVIPLSQSGDRLDFTLDHQ